MLQYVDKVIVTYVNEIREELPLYRISLKDIAIFDASAGHRRFCLNCKNKKPQIPAPFCPQRMNL